MSRKMKKVIAAFAASVLCLSMGVTAFATGSTKEPVAGQEVGTGNVYVKTTQVSDKFASLVTDKKEVEKIFAKFGIKYDKVKLLFAVDIDLSECSKEELRAGVELYSSADVKKGDTVYAYHQKKDGGVELIKCKASNGRIDFTVYSASPFAFFKLDGAKSTASGKTSPKTGEF